MSRPPGPTQPDRDTQNPWERYGWIMGAIWLVFLSFPLKSAFTVETSWVWRLFAITAILPGGRRVYKHLILHLRAARITCQVDVEA